jgi:mannose-6-phosphate isomerase-like protein (cupin superfamily)
LRFLDINPFGSYKLPKRLYRRHPMASLTSTRTPTAYWSLGDLWIVHIGREQTEGRFSLLETQWAPLAALAPLHLHRDTDELYYVLEGELMVHLPGRSLQRAAGGWVYCPRGVPHTYEVTSSTPARLLYVGSPGGFEEFVAAAGEPAGDLTLPPGEPDVSRAIGLASSYGIDVLAPPGERPEGALPAAPASAAYWWLGHLASVHVPGEATERRYSFIEHLSPPGERPALHVHRRESQLWYVLEGELTVRVGGESCRCGPGEWAYGPPAVPHTHEVTSETPARILEVSSPAGFEDFVAAAGEPADDMTVPPNTADFSQAIELAPVYGIDILGTNAV